MAEGSAAQIAIVSNGAVFIQNLLNQAKRLNSVWEPITADDIIVGDSTVGIDIGEDTVNYTMFCKRDHCISVRGTFFCRQH